MLATASPWAVLAYPLLWCAADTLLAHLHPDGNWSSLAYSQAGFAPALQIVSLLGVAGLVFVLSLFPAALALAALRGWPAARWPLAASVLLALGCLGFGYARIPAAALVQGDLVGMAVIDDFIGPRVPAAQAERIWSQYERHVETLAGQGARLVLLPEKIAVLSPAQAEPLRDPARARAGIPARRDALHAHGRSVRLVVYRGGGAAGVASPPPEANRYVPHDADSL
jgi:apolipoprotein N-acyltransferase